MTLHPTEEVPSNRIFPNAVSSFTSISCRRQFLRQRRFKFQKTPWSPPAQLRPVERWNMTNFIHVSVFRGWNLKGSAISRAHRKQRILNQGKQSTKEATKKNEEPNMNGTCSGDDAAEEDQIVAASEHHRRPAQEGRPPALPLASHPPPRCHQPRKSTPLGTGSPSLQAETTKPHLTGADPGELRWISARFKEILMRKKGEESRGAYCRTSSEGWCWRFPPGDVPESFLPWP